ncbi:ABC transporter related [Catenulispora acidiphila DSM 44928]|uniref:ABC transporter related n=1 Tax=Catenulispora acidiphila (strain DSM 44928 / JCM 14897 / NBRC 102108 / NRRL B-24433 / ID139908) TaxID=479433 RepID=C7QJZ1_CATAD|nr:sugar ABC transporter ATP-binding protein [Catenulispora acidiphila]ACU73229.1 ABC transporter related [Catenulispora acidiphila DSM 44928]
MPTRPDEPDPSALPEAGAPTGAPAALQARQVVKSFGGVHALRGADLLVRPGEVHALMGENGAGKSTLIKLLTGVYRPDDGVVALHGTERSFRTPLEAQAAGISTIYQEVNLVPMMSVARNLFLGREPRRYGLVDVRAMNRMAGEILVRYGVRVDVAAPVHTLGLGARQMVALARAVRTDARVVIMDEPTSSLEPREVQTLFGVIRTLREQGAAVVFVSHRLDELYEICDRVTVLRDGRTVHTGPMAALPRTELVALMLGRALLAAHEGRVTAFAPDKAQRRPAADDAALGDLLPAARGRWGRGRDRQAGGPDTPAAGQAALSVSGLTDRHRLRDVSLEVASGEVVGLAGLLGAGRSETAQAVIGAHPASGTVAVRGRQIRRRSPQAAVRAGIAMLAEDRKAEGVIPGLSVRENIVLAALPRLSRAGIVSTARQDRIVEFFMTRLRIKASSPEQKVQDLSGGNQQKVLLARWMCLNPRVLLLDEPTRGIDVGAKAEVQTIVDQLAAEGVGVLLISSELDELLEGSDRVVVLHTGSVAARLEGEQVTAPNLMRALAGERPEGQELDESDSPSGSEPGGADDREEGAS